MLGSGKGDSSARRTRRAAISTVAVAVLLLSATAPVVGDGLNRQPARAPGVTMSTLPASSVQAADAAGLAGISATRPAKRKPRVRTRTVLRRVAISTRITDEIFTEEGKGTFAPIKCPPGAKAISGGLLGKYINLMVSSSSPYHPLNRKYTPNIWWLTIVNVNVDGNGGTLPWQGVVNCLSPARLNTG